MGRYNLQHVDRGIIYLPVHSHMSDTEINNMIKEHQHQGKTIVLLRSGKYDMKNILKELLKTRIES